MSQLLSIVIATADRPKSILRLFESLKACWDAEIAAEILLIDNSRCIAASQDTRGVALKAANDIPVRYHRCVEVGKSFALNYALSLVSGEVIIFIDDDIIVNPYWLRDWSATLHRWPNHNVFGGRIIPYFPANAPFWVKDKRVINPMPNFAAFEFGANDSLIDFEPFGPNMAVRVSAIGDQKFNVSVGVGVSGGYLGEETDFSNKIRGDERVVYAARPFVLHTVRSEQCTGRWLRSRSSSFGRTSAFFNARDKHIGDIQLRVLLSFAKMMYREMLYLLASLLSARAGFKHKLKMEKYKAESIEYLSIIRKQSSTDLR